MLTRIIHLIIPSIITPTNFYVCFIQNFLRNNIYVIKGENVLVKLIVFGFVTTVVKVEPTVEQLILWHLSFFARKLCIVLLKLIFGLRDNPLLSPLRILSFQTIQLEIEK